MSTCRRPLLLTALAFICTTSAVRGQAVDLHIRAVESGLGPAVTISNRPVEHRELLTEMKRLNIPGVSLAVIHEGHLSWAKGYGVTGNGSSQVTENTLFQAASISKSLTAMAALKLVEEGKLSLDAPITTELRSWKLPQSGADQVSVTLRQLLSHTAGTNVHGFDGYAAGQPVPTLLQVLDGSKPANSAPIRVEHIPGTQYSYSGGGYTVVQQMMIDQTGKAFPTLMQDLVLKPAGMRSSSFQQPLGTSAISKAAFPFDSLAKALQGGPHTYPEMAAAGLWTTPTDLAHWIIEVQQSLQNRANHVLSAGSIRTMLSPVRSGYALGTGVQTPSGKPALSHSGGNEGYRCFYFAYQQGEGAVIMTNSDNGGALFGELLGSIAREYQWSDYLPEERTIASIPLAQQLQYVGRFKVNNGPGIEVTSDGSSLRLSIDGGEPRTLIPSSPSTFFVTEEPLQVRFSDSDKGALVFGIHEDSFQRTTEKQ